MNKDNSELTSHLEKFKKETVKKVVKDLLKKYVVLDKNMDKVNEEKLIKDLLSVEEIRRCNGVVNSGGCFTQCTRNAQGEEMYCKIHLKKYQNKLCSNQAQVSQEKLYIVTTEHLDENDLANCRKVFIDDSFYFVDDHFIYDNSNKTLMKVGYIDGGEYVLTDDPFILNHRGECFL